MPTTPLELVALVNANGRASDERACLAREALVWVLTHGDSAEITARIVANPTSAPELLALRRIAARWRHRDRWGVEDEFLAETIDRYIARILPLAPGSGAQ